MLDEAGIPYDEICTHSYRKGSASAAASGSTAAPPIVAICLRAGWKLSGVLNTYLSLENAGDRFVGRVCALLPQMSREFGVLPPSFSRGKVMEENEAKMVAYAMKRQFGSSYRTYGGSFACVLRHCLANLCYHKDWLSKLTPSHPFHTTWLVRNPDKWSRLQRIVGKLRYDGDDENCIGSGIPPWTKLFNRQELLYDIVVKLREEMPEVVENTTRTVMEEHGVAAGTVTQGNSGVNAWRKYWRKCLE